MTCDMDGYTPEDDYGREEYWHCEEPAITTVIIRGSEYKVCEEHKSEEHET